MFPNSARLNWRRSRLQAGLISLAVHALAGLSAAFWLLPEVPGPHGHVINSRWQQETSVVEPPLEATLAEVSLTENAGGQARQIAGWQPRDVVSTELDMLPEPSLHSPGSIPVKTLAPAERTALPESVGTGTATGQGAGDQPGFFGMRPPTGRRVVFVVDNSRSMNHPHESPAKTRLRRLKLELMKCILEMRPEQQFYVIFFSNETTPMPALGMSSAQPGLREPYLRWIAQLPSSGGPTNPLPALEIALRMQPDTICFLTDGDFDKRVKRILMSLHQTHTCIHTFAFGEITAEETLKTLADNNQGEYRFVP